VYGLRNRFVGIAVLAALVSGVVACSEDLSGTAGCPSLCPEQRVDSRDTVLDAFVSVDTTILGYPAIGTESRLLVAWEKRTRSKTAACVDPLIQGRKNKLRATRCACAR